MDTSIEVGGDAYAFSSAHTALHGGVLEPLHGHTYVPFVHVGGLLDSTSTVTDFAVVQKALATAVEPLHRRTLLPAGAPAVDVTRVNSEVHVRCGETRYVFPDGDVHLLPVANTTTEALAAWLLDTIVDELRDVRTITSVRVDLHESQSLSVSVSRVVAPARA